MNLENGQYGAPQSSMASDGLHNPIEHAPGGVFVCIQSLGRESSKPLLGPALNPELQASAHARGFGQVRKEGLVLALAYAC